jgi:hypothetical protein
VSNCSGDGVSSCSGDGVSNCSGDGVSNCSGDGVLVDMVSDGTTIISFVEEYTTEMICGGGAEHNDSK